MRIWDHYLGKYLAYRCKLYTEFIVLQFTRKSKRDVKNCTYLDRFYTHWFLCGLVNSRQNLLLASSLIICFDSQYYISIIKIWRTLCRASTSTSQLVLWEALIYICFVNLFVVLWVPVSAIGTFYFAMVLWHDLPRL